MSMTGPNAQPECKILKLKTGESIISNVTEMGKYYVLNRPMNLITLPIMDKKGNIKTSDLILKNWIEYSTDEDYKIEKNYVLCCGKPHEEIVFYYEQVKFQEEEDKKSGVSLLEPDSTKVLPELPTDKVSSKKKAKSNDDDETDDGNTGHSNRISKFF